jgi:hypothetical protein
MSGKFNIFRISICGLYEQKCIINVKFLLAPPLGLIEASQ